jgi:hypothetical protein
MKKSLLLALCLFSQWSYAQPLTAAQARRDIDSVISVLSDIHPTFNGSYNKRELVVLRDTLNTPLTSHQLFITLQPLVILDGHTTLQFTGQILPDVASPLLPFETVILDNRLFVKLNLSTDTLLKKGTEILTINGNPVLEIISRISRTGRHSDHDGGRRTLEPVPET